eukprot:gene5686-6873_t
MDPKTESQPTVANEATPRKPKKYIGITERKRTFMNVYEVTIRTSEGRVYLGTHQTLEKAAQTYNEAAAERGLAFTDFVFDQPAAESSPEANAAKHRNSPPTEASKKNVTPVAQKNATPAAEKTTPAAEKTTPAVEKTTPAAEKTTPAVEKTTPATQKTTPATQKTTPATQKTTPATQKTTPASQKTTPATQKPTPATQKPTPAAEKTTPAATHKNTASAAQESATPAEKKIASTASQKSVAAVAHKNATPLSTKSALAAGATTPAAQNTARSVPASGRGTPAVTHDAMLCQALEGALPSESASALWPGEKVVCGQILTPAMVTYRDKLMAKWHSDGRPWGVMLTCVSDDDAHVELLLMKAIRKLFGVDVTVLGKNNELVQPFDIMWVGSAKGCSLTVRSVPCCKLALGVSSKSVLEVMGGGEGARNRVSNVELVECLIGGWPYVFVVASRYIRLGTELLLSSANFRVSARSK